MTSEWSSLRGPNPILKFQGTAMGARDLELASYPRNPTDRSAEELTPGQPIESGQPKWGKDAHPKTGVVADGDVKRTVAEYHLAGRLGKF